MTRRTEEDYKSVCKAVKYDLENGVLRWRRQVGLRGVKGEEVGNLDGNGYRSFRHNKKNYQAHRVIFFMLHGYVPEYIDHVDGNRLNNSPENLREATASQNAQNQSLRSDNNSGVKGVAWCNTRGGWRSRVCMNGKEYFCGVHGSVEEAEKAVRAKREELHGEYANHG